MPISNTIF